MGNLRVCTLLALAACGSDHGSTADAQIVVHDAPSPDSKVFMDAPPVQGDFSCFGMTAGTSVATTITASGTTQTISMSGAQPVPGLQVAAFKVGGNTAVATVTSDTAAAFTTGPITTGGTALEHLVGRDPAATPTYRTTYLYPSYPVRADITGVPMIVVTESLFSTLQTFAGATQDDTMNGGMLIQVADCAGASINGATLKVQQGGTDKGDVFDLGALAPQAAGTFFVFNVPDGATQVFATVGSMTFPSHTVMSHKKPNGANQVGTITATNLTPGPLN